VKGIARTTLLLLCWSAMTRWLLGVGIVLTGLGLCALGTGAHPAARPFFVIVAITGVITTVISPVLMGAVVFRSLSAPRALQLIPGGRLQLLLGAGIVHLVLAAFVSGVAAVMVGTGPASPATLPESSGNFFAALFVVTYATLTLQFLGHYLASRSRLGGFWLLTWPLWVRLIMIPLQNPHLHTVFGTRAGLGAMATISVLAWLAFAISYLTARHIAVPHWNNIGMGQRQRSESTPQNLKTQPERGYTRREAIRTVLTGGPRQQRVLLVMLVALVVMLLVAIAVRSHLPRGAGYPLVGLICMMAGPLTGSFAGVMAQRAKPLWLQSGLGRIELFAALEARSWGVVLCASVLCGALAAGWLAVSAGPSPLRPSPLPAWSVGVLVTPLASGAMFIYAQLQFVRGRRVVDILLMALAIGLWMSEFFSVVVGADTSVVTALLAAQIILAPLLRVLARRRWENIDWLIHKGARNPWGLT
jgi:hypothetical protein